MALTPCSSLAHESGITRSGAAVRATDVRIHQGTPLLVREYVDGIDLDEVDVRRRRALGYGLPLWFVCEVLAQVAEGLAAAHLTGILHRDLKPSNILDSPELGTRLGDFGTCCWAAAGCARCASCCTRSPCASASTTCSRACCSPRRPRRTRWEGPRGRWRAHPTTRRTCPPSRDAPSELQGRAPRAAQPRSGYVQGGAHETCHGPAPAREGPLANPLQWPRSPPSQECGS
ncbi:MAG TPA: protein kinase [Myxococcaceae bacterium]|nr:protein kinase [Myxococcaceae bacterium]